MNFQSIPPVDTAQAHLDHALKEAGKRALMLKRSQRKGNPFLQLRHLERQRLDYVADELEKSLARIPKSFPSLERLPEFYAELMDATLDRVRLQKDLAATAWAATTVARLCHEFCKQYGYAQTRDELLATKRQAIGRISSVMKQVGKPLAHIEACRKVLRTFPDLKDGVFTVAIAGFPNVGKSTLLSKLTTAKPEIKNYAFTTKTLNVGYFLHRHNQVQCVDTPGTLDRPEKLNGVEQQAYLAMKYSAHLIVYVYDLTETYPLADQEALEGVVRSYGKDVLLFLSKTDVADPRRVAAFLEKRPGAITSLPALQRTLAAALETEYLGLKRA